MIMVLACWSKGWVLKSWMTVHGKSRMRSERKSEAIILNSIQKKDVNLITQDCVIRWNDTLETEEARIALAMDADTEKDDEIFFYCDSLNDMKSMADKGREDFTIAECIGFGTYEELL